jgi:hypothetical protein
LSVNRGNEKERVHLLRRTNQHKVALGLHDWVRAALPNLVLHLDNTDGHLLFAGGTGNSCRSIRGYYPGVDSYLRRNETPQDPQIINLGLSINFVFVEIEGGIDKIQCVVQFLIREFQGSGRMGHLSDKCDKCGVVYLYRRTGQEVGSVIINRILAPFTLVSQQCRVL